MPLKRCEVPTCDQLIPERGYCPAHAHLGSPDASRHREYSRFRRDREAGKFYGSAAWKRVRAAQLTAHPTCEMCGGIAVLVHHRKARKEAPELELEPSNLASLCWSCHSKIEASCSSG